MFGLGERTKRAATIAESAREHLDPGDEVLEVVQVQTGRTAGANAAAVAIPALGTTTLDFAVPISGHRVQSMAVLATDRNLYVVTLTGARLLNVGQVAFKAPLASAQVTIEDSVITLAGQHLHVMQNWGKHVERLRDLVQTS